MNGATPRRIFVTGGTGYLGCHLLPELVQRGHEVTALVRSGSERKLASGCRPVPGDPLNQATFQILIHAVEHPPQGIRIIEAPEMRQPVNSS